MIQSVIQFNLVRVIVEIYPHRYRHMERQILPLTIKSSAVQLE
jgi:hypothetical protein